MSFSHDLALFLQRIPLVNQIPFVRDAHTVESAIGGLLKSTERLSKVAEVHASAAATKLEVAAGLKKQADAHAAAATQANAIAANLTALTTVPAATPAAPPATNAGPSA